MSLPYHLEKHRQYIESIAQAFGLDYFETIFEVVSAEDMNMIAAYGGFPTRYPHWKFGMQYEQLSKSHQYGLSRIFELVINNDPCYAYLVDSNTELDQKLVMAHVFGHADFFKNNFSFMHTDRKMIDNIANHATKVRRYIDKFGYDKVESFLERAHCCENLIDRHTLSHTTPFKNQEDEEENKQIRLLDVPQLRTDREYMRSYINPESYLEEQRKKMESELNSAKKFPQKITRDILGFLIEYAPLKNYERELLSIVRNESYYFSPQAQTKIMNEGWASYWHTTMMTQKILSTHEVIDYADRHSGTTAQQPGNLNPYKLGLELFRYIEWRWNKGQFGKEWDECEDWQAKQNWDLALGKGREKIFEVRKIYNDVTFIDEFLTPDFVDYYKMYTFGYNPNKEHYEIFSRQFKTVKSQLLSQLTNVGDPFIYVLDGNFENRGELLLGHRHEGTDLQQKYMKETLVHLQALWSRPVSLATKMGNEGRLISFDGQDFHEKTADVAAFW
jgi:stage V sporulation protein R